MPQQTPDNSLKLKESDFTGDAYRPNRRFQLLEQAVADLRQQLSQPRGPASSADSAGIETPVDAANINVAPGSTVARSASQANSIIHYGPASLRESDYVAAYHLGELFIETGSTPAIWQSQVVGETPMWVKIV